MIESPHTPHVEVHESKQQQQAAHTVSSEDHAGQGLLPRLLLADFPDADRELLAAWAANRLVDVGAAWKALAGFPTATLADWQADLAAGAGRDDVRLPEALALSSWAKDGERVQAERYTAPPPERSQRAERRSDRPSDRAILHCTWLTPTERAEWLRKYAAAEDKHQILWSLQKLAHERERAAEARKHGQQERPVEPPASPAAPVPAVLQQAWNLAIATLQLRVSRDDFLALLRPMRLAALEGEVVTVTAPGHLVKDLTRRYLAELRAALSDALSAPVQLRIVGGAA